MSLLSATLDSEYREYVCIVGRDAKCTRRVSAMAAAAEEAEEDVARETAGVAGVRSAGAIVWYFIVVQCGECAF